MTIAEIKETVPTLALWMAYKAVMEGVRMVRKSHELRDIEEKKRLAGKPCNFLLAHAYDEGMRASAEVLWKLFATCSYYCQRAIEKVSCRKDGFCGDPITYFDDFVTALEEAQGYPVSIRTSE